MTNYKLTLEYDGTEYHGFQIQPQLPTIQNMLEEAISCLGSLASPIYPAGRTDAGVHARGQVVSFKASMKPQTSGLAGALNAYLPADIVAKACREVDDDFNARRNALAREYVYYLHLGKHPSPFNRRFTYHYEGGIDLEAMATALELILGQHDFAAFCRREEGKSTVREVQEVEVSGWRDIIGIRVKANAFAWMMMRMLCGSLLEVGRGKWPVERFREVLESRDNAASGPALPSHGLILERVYY